MGPLTKSAAMRQKLRRGVAEACWVAITFVLYVFVSRSYSFSIAICGDNFWAPSDEEYAVGRTVHTSTQHRLHTHTNTHIQTHTHTHTPQTHIHTNTHTRTHNMCSISIRNVRLCEQTHRTGAIQDSLMIPAASVVKFSQVRPVKLHPGAFFLVLACTPCCCWLH